MKENSLQENQFFSLDPFQDRFFLSPVLNFFFIIHNKQICDNFFFGNKYQKPHTPKSFQEQKQ